MFSLFEQNTRPDSKISLPAGRVARSQLFSKVIMNNEARLPNELR